MTSKGSPVTLRSTEIKRPKPKSAEVEHAVTYSDNSPAKKTKVQCTKPPAIDGFEGALEDAIREMNLLLSKYSEVVWERAVMDAALEKELESIVSEAINLESQLKEKKEHLRRSLATISDKLEG